MYLYFNNLKINGFQSIGEAEIDLAQRGIIYVKGINNYEKSTESNGSGKSSIFESILWCVYGKTSSGVSDVKNKYYAGDLKVELNLIIDNINYKIVREESSLKLYKENEDISGRNKTDTQKMIISIINIDIDLFTSLIFLSQGFNSKLSVLTPSVKKDRIERLTNSSVIIDNFKNKFSELKLKYSSLNSDKLKTIGSVEGKISYITKEIKLLEDKVNSYTESARKDIPDINLLQDKLNSLNLEYNSIISDLENNTSEYNNLNNEINVLKNTKQTYFKNIQDLESKKNNITSNNSCYACHQKLNSDISKAMLIDINNKIDEFNTLLSGSDSKLQDLSIKLEPIGNTISKLNDSKTKFKSSIDRISNIINEYKNTELIDINSVKNDIILKKNELKDLNIELETNNSELSNIQDKLDIINHCMTLLTRQFRSYMMKNIIDFMNTRLKEYSLSLYSNNTEYISIDYDLNILYGDCNYNALSGGEKRKIDIALVFTQRDLALNLSGVTSNLLILDEIYDNLDDKAISVVSDLISNISNIDSMFVISHMKNVDIKYDSILTAVKNINRISNIIEE